MHSFVISFLLLLSQDVDAGHMRELDERLFVPDRARGSWRSRGSSVARLALHSGFTLHSRLAPHPGLTRGPRLALHSGTTLDPPLTLHSGSPLSSGTTDRPLPPLPARDAGRTGRTRGP